MSLNLPTGVDSRNNNGKLSPGTYNVRKMHTALKLNEYMRERSSDAQLIIVNLPGPPEPGYDSYCKFFDSKVYN